MMDNPNLTHEELYWVNLLWKVHFSYKIQMQRQISVAKIVREYTPYYLFLNFYFEEKIPPIPQIIDPVPIELLIQHIPNGENQNGKIYISPSCHSNMKIENQTEGIYPTSFLLHVFEGYVRQLEIYNLDLSTLNKSTMCIGRKDYRLSPELIETC